MTTTRNRALSIAVISDTHCTVPFELLDAIKSADEIWHLGDVSSPQALAQIAQLNLPLEVVQGNTDPYGSYPDTLTLTRFEVKFQLQHFPPTPPVSESCDVILHGHLHRPSNDQTNIPRILSPGAVTGPRGGTTRGFAWLRFYGNLDWTWDRVEF